MGGPQGWWTLQAQGPHEILHMPRTAPTCPALPSLWVGRGIQRKGGQGGREKGQCSTFPLLTQTLSDFLN